MNLVDEILQEIEGSGKQSGAIIKTHVGTVREVKDEVVFIDGLQTVSYGEMLRFKAGSTGMVIDLLEDGVGAIVFGNYELIEEGETVEATGDVFSIAVSDDFIGRVVDGIGSPIDGKGSIKATEKYQVEKVAPGIIYRKSVSEPVQTGIKAIDALVPIGRGQRELIIGDRGTGKSTIAIDTILNQKKGDMICIYTIIGQKKSTTATLIELLKKQKAMEYTIVVAATASDSAAMQYIAPYVATTIGEYFMEKGKDVLVVYDDLTKHAWAYRQISLILRRPAGREAYPGDVFYLHSRLLERSAKIDKKYGGGSLTALPIIQTLEGDVSAYIPTNVISITDGQIFLETDLFNSGIRPAINVGISVSRVGSSAQTKAMKQVAGKLKNDLAQYRELAAFAQFESELDDKTKQFIDRGARMTQLLRQKKNAPLSLSAQVAILWMGANGYLDAIPVAKIEALEIEFNDFMQTSHTKLLEKIEIDKKIEEGSEKELHKIAEMFIKKQKL
ncbi:F0F1 ATP synthase subunit alpha [Candidatus Roizmanbacteria bacterium RIFCSPHIGHO2_02_FULL_40_13b]|uniref:ATP synthase subunit alpha n=1 Tax=Candidatus Roizmanbacteria bacterium RIFCSPHIGHO2_01_FULL_39_24 TaxID=1802032 RepID=A0A1F7GFL7_9BACT|nr:MAG: F0F1 ATP synthase subunit alpha [Candidatus Roizmanbacteria bacterium RIFCSPHIGHO2_01_FULL_39_24]OGK26421.1 MAG: F0F1 ATP synthase subunit alpha [Candidatus Roizmanbacteria bacterium RIFCSPHIGHO2_02_FULL_40_13b]OGK49033.1 MAG: F0F1 ATP synthase subunit alpha [Candidatus Roizmanbacteria bacterium RIFCSPLOWO2_01_FULL_40_32]OGK57043.1 MAG: F0F1 ATP synthase subunit alpha [Candidatus Roizmanbacteria bacterium RIFCSPLOWO2_02_FULL_39_8]